MSTSRIASTLLLAAVAGCGTNAARNRAAEESERPAARLLTISGEMQEQLGLKVQSASKREVTGSLTATGWLEAQPGREVVVKSPVPGFVTAESGRPLPQIGQTVEKSQRLAALQVFLTPQEVAQLVIAKEDTDREMEQSLVSMKLAEKQLDRLLQLAQDAVAGARLDVVREIYERSRVAYREAREKLPFLLKEPYDDLALGTPVRLDAPISGHIVDLHVAPDQFVVQGDALWTIADWSTLWVRVPVFESDLASIQRSSTAEMVVPGTLQTARLNPVRALQPTRPGLRTVELLYELPNPNGDLVAGQSVTVNLPTGRDAERVVIPQSAVLWGGVGDGWVYVRVDAESFRRQRIETGQTLGKEIVVSRGLAGDEEVVAIGAESLYGQEFGGSIQEDDD